MIKAVLLDVDNTLLDFNLNAAHSMKAAFSSCNLEYNDSFFDVFLEVNTDLWDKIERRQITREELKRDRFKFILEKLGIKGDSAQLESLFRENLGKFAFPVEGAMDMINYLEKKYRLFVASNAIYKQQILRLTKSNMISHFEKLFISEKIGFDKPSKEYFNYCIENIGGVTAKEVAIIGDSLSADISGASAVGIITVWFNIHGKSAPNAPLADYTITKLSQIESIL